MTGEEFKKARKRLGLTVRELAEILDTNPVTIRKWETPPGKNTARSPNPIACQVLRWIESGELSLKGR